MIIVGLGNPGTQYKNTHHNAGFISIDYIANKYSADFKLEKKFEAEIASFKQDGENIIFVKPQTYMNLSGIAVQKIASYYKEASSNVFIIFDDIELPLGVIRVRKNGSGGSHNGMKNIIQMMGTQEIPRIRIGLGVDRTMDLKDFVLSKISSQDMAVLDKVNEKIYIGLDSYIKEKNIDKLMQKLNGKVE